MKIETGKRENISLMTLLAIWSIWAITSLPRLAVSPISGNKHFLLSINKTDLGVQNAGVVEFNKKIILKNYNHENKSTIPPGG